MSRPREKPASLKTLAVARQKKRKQLREAGFDEDEVQACIREMKERQRQKVLGYLPVDAPLITRASYMRWLRSKGKNTASASALNQVFDYEPPDDAGYKPPKVDSVLTGVARATGAAAKAVKRGKTFTKYELREESA